MIFKGWCFEMLRRLLVVCTVTAIVSAGPQLSETDNILHSALKIVKECGDKSVVLCMKVSRQGLCS